MRNRKDTDESKDLEIIISPFRDFKSILFYGFGSLFVLISPYQFIVNFDRELIVEFSIVSVVLFLVDSFVVVVRHLLWCVRRAANGDGVKGGGRWGEGEGENHV